ncbi:mitotic spindle assembly checkpoint protein MAD2B-like [Haliotis cracherodii]|uniref:mitotic spindle assembly checkpoint protein MAD2B-like n=1 Tax=Haliotis rufescens TaxID=6454 RepID=UPI001EAFC486|nr:mitotic spindle assembly checkpoint protein MAD2B-like [Haliotis rufescens]
MENVSCLQVSSDVLSEFLEVAVHCILYNRGLYPAGVFVKRKKYNVPVQMCLHPEVKEYVIHVVDGVRWLLEQGEVETVAIVVLRADNSPLERFVFEIADTHSTRSKTDEYLFQLEQSLRAFLLKLNICDSVLQPLPEDCTWTVHIHTRESAAQKLDEKQVIKVPGRFEEILHSRPNFPWVEADEKQQKMEDSKLVPLKSMKSDFFKMQLFVEESAKKTS